MGTVVEIRVYDESPERYDEAVSDAFAEMAAVEKLMSPHLPESEISRLSSASEPFRVSGQTLEVLQIAQEVTIASHGAFNAALGRLINLWGFAEGEPQLPADIEIEKALEDVGLTSFSIENSTVTKKSPQLAIDLGGVAKGYAIDRAIAVLTAAGVRHASVNAGGDMRLLGDRSGVAWRIGIQHPRQTGTVLARLNLSDRSVVTSGDYERFFEKDGVRYHHVLGPDEGLTLLQATADVEGLIVVADGSVVMTPGLQEFIEWP